MPVPISVTGFATTAGSQEVHAEVAETGPSASDWFSKVRNDKSGESDDVDTKEEVAATPGPTTMDVDEDDARAPSTATPSASPNRRFGWR